MNRSVGVFALVLSGCSFGGSLGNAAFDAEFIPACQSECTAQGGGATCAPYCTCMAARIHTDHREEWSENTPEDQMLADPWFQQVTGVCGSDYHDAAFTVGCTTGNVGFEAYCACTLQQLRAGMSREDGTVWMIQNIEQATPTPAGEARMTAATTACVSLAPAQ